MITKRQTDNRADNIHTHLHKMPTKDRLFELHQVAKHGAVISRDSKMEDEGLQDIFQEASTINKHIDAIEENTQICENILSNTTAFRAKELQSKLDATFKSSEKLSYDVSKRLKQMHGDSKIFQKKSTRARVKELQYASVSARFKNALERHQECVRSHLDMRKDLLEKCNKIVNGSSINEEDLEELVEKSSTQLFVGDYLTQERETRQQLLQLEDRHKELIKIESHLGEIRDLFVQAAILIEQQQESVNRVEYHASTAAENIENTVVELRGANKNKKKSRKKLTWFIVIAIILVLILIIGIIL